MAGGLKCGRNNLSGVVRGSGWRDKMERKGGGGRSQMRGVVERGEGVQ